LQAVARTFDRYPHLGTMTATALASLTLGDSLFVDGDHDGAIENYTAAICMTDSRRKVAAASPATENDAATSVDAKDGSATGDEETTKLVRFHSLSHRSESYIGLSKFPHAYNDAAAALAIFPQHDSVDDSKKSNAAIASSDANATASNAGVRPVGLAELALAHDRVARASVGLASQKMAIGGRSRSTGRVAFVRMTSPGMMGSSNEMEDEARDHWGSALALAAMLADSDDGNDSAEKEEEGAKKKKKGRSAAEEGARLVERFRKQLKKLDGEEEEEENKEKKEPEKQDNNPLSGMMASMMAAGKGAETSNPPNTSSKPPSTKTKTTKSTSSSPPAPATAPSRSSPPSKEPSNHPASARKTSPVDRGVMSGVPKYQYYQDDNFMKIQILEPNVQAENLTTEFTADEISVKIKKHDGSGGALVEYAVIHGDLFEEVVPEKCRAIIKEEKILVKLKKKESKLEWSKLLDESKGGDRKKSRLEKRAKAENGGSNEGGDGAKENAADNAKSGNDDDANKTAEAVPKVSTAKTRPYASHRDWDAIDRNLAAKEAAEKPEGDEALNKLFQQIYQNANEDTRRAMVKSMQTSGGTCLSTNWDEVEKTDYEAERQAPKGMEWKDYEGKKLPMKEDD